MRVAIGCDHRGWKLKQFIIELLAEMKHSYKDFGCSTPEAVDYPDIARKVAEAVATGDCDKGILICGTGIGMSIAANKVKGIRAALCHDALAACLARQHNDANILCLSAGQTQQNKEVSEIIKAFLTSEFEGGRHQRRVDKIKNIES